MALSIPQKELRQLKRFVGEIEQRFLRPHVSRTTLAPPSRAEQLDVAAFAVLVHGALENFVEGLALAVANRIHANWLRKRANRNTVALLMGANPSTDFAKETRTVFDQIRASLDDAKNSHSSAIKENNGITLKHLRRLFLRVGVDVPTDPVLIGSLDSLIKMRHEWAHQYRHQAKTIKSAADVAKIAKDCVALAERLCNAVLALKL